MDIRKLEVALERVGRGSAHSIGRSGGLRNRTIGLLATLLATLACTPPQPPGFPQEGTASWYGRRFAGRATASGETFDPDALTAAHRTLPFDTRVRVHNLETGEDVIVRINDRGPYVHGRIIDLSRAAARAIGILEPGLTRVRLEVLGR